MSLDPFRNDHLIERRARSRGDGFVLGSFQLVSKLLLCLVCCVILVPLLVLAIRAITAREPPPANVPGEITNVHSLGVNPRDGSLYAATLRGLYRVTGLYEAVRIAESYQQNSGFTVIGPDRFISSGRPDIRDLISDFEPEMMGLQQSTNAGQTWRSVSLKGQASFSYLEVSAGLIYGYETSRAGFMVSRDDGRTWTILSMPPPFLDFAVSPSDATTIVALTEGGALTSGDGGVTWQSMSVPELFLISWQDELWGVDEAGTVHRSNDGGSPWEVQGVLPGPAEAFLAAADGLYGAVRGQGIFVSTDSGRTWLARYLLPTPF